MRCVEVMLGKAENFLYVKKNNIIHHPKNRIFLIL